ncbi:MAG TPA: isoamylase early set domain-containing protein [Hanamia sp.]|nr:isoamylase early set domain-containing protein [Hanamia sp.]
MNGATEALLLGDFNNWSLEDAFLLEEQEDGSFKTTVPLEVGETYQYRFLLNDGRWVNDYNAQNYVPVAGFSVDNCVITVPETLTEVAKKAKPKKKKETVKPKTSVSAKSGDKKVKKAATKKAKDTTEKTKAKKSERPAKKSVAKDKE